MIYIKMSNCLYLQDTPAMLQGSPLLKTTERGYCEKIIKRDDSCLRQL